MPPIDFQTHPNRYRHWRLDVDAPVATLTMAVDPSAGLHEGYELKTNSYDLGVDIEQEYYLALLVDRGSGRIAIVVSTEGGVDIEGVAHDTPGKIQTLTIDPATGLMWAADVGQNIWEEINILEKGGNYGWNVRESFHKFDEKNAKPGPGRTPDLQNKPEDKAGGDGNQHHAHRHWLGRYGRQRRRIEQRELLAGTRRLDALGDGRRVQLRRQLGVLLLFEVVVADHRRQLLLDARRRLDALLILRNLPLDIRAGALQVADAEP